MMTFLLTALEGIRSMNLPRIPIYTILWVSLWLRISIIGAELKSLKRGYRSWRLRQRSLALAQQGRSLQLSGSVYSRSFAKPLPPQLSSLQQSSQLSKN